MTFSIKKTCRELLYSCLGKSEQSYKKNFSGSELRMKLMFQVQQHSPESQTLWKKCQAGAHIYADSCNLLELGTSNNGCDNLHLVTLLYVVAAKYHVETHCGIQRGNHVSYSGTYEIYTLHCRLSHCGQLKPVSHTLLNIFLVHC